MRIHFIAIGGSAMHNLAIALHKKGHIVTGSDDEIFEPSKSRLATYKLLPAQIGWFPSSISKILDAVILGMHARPDNPELIKAQALGVRIFSYPEFLYEQTKNKTRVVIGGSHGKTTITSMVMHVLKENSIDFDYMVGAQLEGFETMVELKESTELAVFEGDEYLSSPIDRRPKFHLYEPHIALITGIAWDHINVFPTFDNYKAQFSEFVDKINSYGTLIYFEGDSNVRKMCESSKIKTKIPYSAHAAEIENGLTCLKVNNYKIPVQVFGNHNMENISGAKEVCNKLGISDAGFYKAISTFYGAHKRLQILAENNDSTLFLDFAHSPSKLKATTEAVKQQFPKRQLIACMELHTFSSLKKEFLPFYKNCMEKADVAYVYFNPHTMKHKKLEPITKQMVNDAFAKINLKVFTNSDALFDDLGSVNWRNKNLLLMSSGNFDGKNLPEIAKELILDF